MDDVLSRSDQDVAELVGRTRELRIVDSLVGRAADRGGAFMFTGEPGVGKSVLLEQACRTATASGVGLLRAAGVEFEADVSCAALNQLLLPLHDEMQALTDLHRGALMGALGMDGGRADERAAPNGRLTDRPPLAGTDEDGRSGGTSQMTDGGRRLVS